MSVRTVNDVAEALETMYDALSETLEHKKTPRPILLKDEEYYHSEINVSMRTPASQSAEK